jgi:hypothetical protein
VAARADITVFSDHLADQDAVVQRLAPFDVVCVMRERTPLPRNVIERLPRLKMIASTGPFNASIDVVAAKERGIYVSTTGGYVESTVELTWALILATARRIVDESLSVRGGGWQTSVGHQLGGSVLGVLGLGVQRRVVQPRRRPDDPSGAQRAHPRSGRRGRIGLDETNGVASQHIPRPDRRRDSSRRRDGLGPDCRRRT